MTTTEQIRKRLEKYVEPPDTQASHRERLAMASEVTRDEMNAKLETIEVRMDARISRIEESNARIESGIASMKTTVIVTAVGAVLSIVFGIAAFNATLLSSMTASFESGKTTAASISDAANQLKQTQEDIRMIRERLDRPAQTPIAPAK
jgi:hypothetical protein